MVDVVGLGSWRRARPGWIREDGGGRRERRVVQGMSGVQGRVGGCGWVRGWMLDPAAVEGSDFIERGDPRERS